MTCPNEKFDTQNLFSNPCSCSQQHIQLEDNTRMRMGNSTGFERIADRDITNFEPSNNGPQVLQTITGSEAAYLRYYPSTGSTKENPVNSNRFVNIGYTSPNKWKQTGKEEETEYDKKTDSGITKEAIKGEEYDKPWYKKMFGSNKEKFTSATNAYNGVQYGPYLDKQQKQDAEYENKEGFCGYHSRPINYTSCGCIVIGIVCVVILALLIYYSCFKNPCCCCKPCDTVSERSEKGGFPVF